MKRKLEDVEQSEHKLRKIQEAADDIKTSEFNSDTRNDQLRAVLDTFITIYEKLDDTDVVDEKPKYSYTELIYLAILTSPNFCLTTPEIYKYLQRRFVYFRNNTGTHWRNAVRHSLSKTKCFRKIRVVKGPGSKLYHRHTFLWSIDLKSLTAYVRGDYRPCMDRNNGKNALVKGFYETKSETFWQNVASSIEYKLQVFQRTLSFCSNPMILAKQQSCVWSAKQQSCVSSAEHQSCVSPAKQHPCVSPVLINIPKPPSAFDAKVSLSPPLPLNTCLSEEEPATTNATVTLDSGKYIPRFTDSDEQIDSNRMSPFSCDSDSGISSCSSLKEDNLNSPNKSPICHGLNISSLLDEETLGELSDQSSSLYRSLPAMCDGYNFLYNPLVPAEDYISRGVVSAPSVISPEPPTFETVMSNYYNSLYYPVNPYIRYCGYYG